MMQMAGKKEFNMLLVKKTKILPVNENLLHKVGSSDKLVQTLEESQRFLAIRSLLG
jgi:hypothetical protein